MYAGLETDFSRMFLKYIYTLRTQSEIFVKTFAMHIYNKQKQDLEDYASHLEAVLNTVLDGIITIDHKGTIQGLNPSATRIFGYMPEEIIGQNVKMLMPEPYKSEHDQYLKNYLDGGQGKIIGIGREVEAKRKEGTVFPMELAVSEMQISGERMFVGTIRDITSRRQAENEIIRSNTELENFAYIASHDLQEPLRMIINFTSMLESDYGEQLDDQALEYMHFVSDGASRMKNMIDDLLEYSRIGHDDDDDNVDEINTRDQCELVIMNLHEAIEETNANIILGDLPAVKINPTRFSSLMQNLIANALKYKRPGISPEIKIDALDLPNVWRFSVSDNGIGIKPEYLKQIFIVFKRLHSHREFQGTGIGLTICKKIVESYGGKIWATSEEGQGTTFHFTIPKKINL